MEFAGNRMKSTQGGVSTIFVGGIYEKGKSWQSQLLLKRMAKQRSCRHSPLPRWGNPRVRRDGRQQERPVLRLRGSYFVRLSTGLGSVSASYKVENGQINQQRFTPWGEGVAKQRAWLCFAQLGQWYNADQSQLHGTVLVCHR
jgi:hypothetical protein